ncbi:AraC family transcriptional regulator [Marinobacter salexigens]|uniref:AraC family transcriptional regulator n=1 Tax=Marinobacter salexigens TaxID=1925763 RepID=A0ABS6A7K3_9GAMM|nr:AraC family transcriptional regulator [Marinobacter salexigens]MBU2874078.1 AraC family transcriptional regulator [Marinobacter salexigens]
MQRREIRDETSQIALNFFKHFRQCLTDMNLQVDLSTQLEQLGLDLNSLNSGESSLSFQQYYQLLEIVASQIPQGGFFLRLGSRYNITDIGVLGYASLSAESLRKSWDLTFNGTVLLPHPITGKRSVRDGRVSVVLEWPARSLIDPRALQEEWLAATWSWICQRIPEVSESTELQLKLAYPDLGYRSVYEDIFPGIISFDQPETELSFPESWYDLPFPAANPATSRLCHEQCLLIMAQLDEQSNLVNEVRQTLLLSPQRRFLSQEEMAARFKIPTYTFHRRLKKAGTNYRHIVSEVRMELAKKYLESTAIPLQEISYLLGYEYPPNFYRAFKKWFGYTTESIRGKA